MEWRTTETNYEVSDSGNVRRIGSNTTLKSRVDKYGYELVTLWVNGVALTRKVHRLVALAFIPNPEELPTVDHDDDNKLNNCKDNLKWMTFEGNLSKGFKTGAHTIGEGRLGGRPVKLVDSDILKIRKMILEGLGNSEIGHVFGVTCGCIYSIRAGKSWKHIV